MPCTPPETHTGADGCTGLRQWFCHECGAFTCTCADCWCSACPCPTHPWNDELPDDDPDEIRAIVDAGPQNVITRPGGEPA
jgi:hypothetical protein